jgi:hypothetical protein
MFYNHLFIYVLLLSRREGRGAINRCNLAIFKCLFQASVICRGSFVFSELKWEVIIRFIDIDGSVNYLLPTTLHISERGSNGSYRNTDEVRWRDSVSDEL